MSIDLQTIGATSARLRRVANGADRLSFTVPSATALTDSLLATPNTFDTVTFGGHTFYGRIARVRKSGNPAEESQTVEMEGLWTVLQQITYLQSWTIWDPDNEEAIAQARPRVILGMDASGARITTGAQITDAINWAIARGAPITLGTIDTGIALPWDERENITVADVILSVLRLLPDYVAWFAGNTFHCRRRSNLSPVSIAVTDCVTLNHTERRDLQIPGVIVQYEKSHDDDGTARTSIETDTAGNTANWATVRLLYDLQGRSRSFLKASIETQDIPADLITDKAFLKQLVPWLATIADGDLTITSASRGSVSPLPRMLLKGPIPDWLPKHSEEETLTWVITYNVKVGDPPVLVETRANVTVTANIIATDADTRTYNRLSAADSGEETPTGIADALYAAWGTLWHEGSLTLENIECPTTYAPGQVLTVNGATAPIQEVDHDLVAGRTTISFGPPARIEADTLLALFRGLRARRYAWSRNERTHDEPGGDGGQIDQGALPPKSEVTQGGGQTRRLVLTDSDGYYDHIIDLHPAGVTHADTGDAAPRTIAPREVLIAENNAEAIILKRRQVLASESYGDPIKLPSRPGTNTNDLFYWDASAEEWVVLPAPPTTGNYYLKVEAGTLKWQVAGNCI